MRTHLATSALAPMRLTMTGAKFQSSSVMVQPMVIATHRVRAVIRDTWRHCEQGFLARGCKEMVLCLSVLNHDHVAKCGSILPDDIRGHRGQIVHTCTDIC